MQGFFHIKITNSITHILELVPDNHKTKVSSAITAFNSGSVALISSLIFFVEDDEQRV